MRPAAELAGMMPAIQAEILASMTEGVSVSDGQGFIVYTNPAEDRLFGYEPGELIGKHVSLQNAYPPDENELIVNAVFSELKTKGHWEGEWHNKRKDGSTFFTDSRISVIEIDGHSYFLCVQRDVTERKTAEAAAAASEAYNQALFENLAIGIAIVSLDGRWLHFNGALPKMLGYTREELLKVKFSDVTHPDEVERDWNDMSRCAAGEFDSFVREKRYIRKDGAIIWANRTVSILRDADGKPLSFLGAIEDITSRVEAERALRDSERRYRALSTATASLVWATDRDGLVEDIPGWREITGQTPEEVKGYGWLEAIHPDDQETTRKMWRAAYESGSLYDATYRLRQKDGSYCWVNARGVPLFNDKGELLEWVGVLEDVHEARLQAQALRESEAQYRQVAEGLPEIVWSAAPDGRLTFVNQRIFGYSGISSDAVVRGSWLRVIHRDDRSSVMRAWTEGAESGSRFEVELRLRNQKGDYCWFLTRAMAIRSESGEITQWFGTCTYIHDHKATQRALQMTNQFATTLATDLDLERIVQALCDASTSAIEADFGSFFYNVINEGGESFLLYTLSGAPKEAFEKFGMPRATQVFGPTFRGEGIVRSDDIRQDPRYGNMGPPHHGMPEGHLPVVSYLAVAVVSRSGEVIGGLFFGHKKPGVFTAEHEQVVSSFAAQAAVAIDNARLYERVRSMNQELERKVHERTANLLTANERLQAFTYHVSHDLRAPLRAIIGTSRMIQEDYGPQLPEAVHGFLKRQAEAAAKMGQLVDDLLKISRLSRQEMVTEHVDLTHLAKDAAEEALSIHPYSTVDVQVEEGLAAEADPRLLRLALVNLIENAVKYSPRGGVVRVGARDQNTFFVSDQGIGIDETYLERIFEPFYRLHRDEEFTGTGIGLANVRQVVERHAGKVWAESEAGHGTTFYFTLRPATG